MEECYVSGEDDEMKHAPFDGSRHTPGWMSSNPLMARKIHDGNTPSLESTIVLARPRPNPWFIYSMANFSNGDDVGVRRSDNGTCKWHVFPVYGSGVAVQVVKTNYVHSCLLLCFFACMDKRAP